MEYLKGCSVYLSGPIEYDDGKFNWRIEPIKVLTDRFGLNVFDPSEDPKQQWAPALNEARNEKNYDEMTRIAKRFVRKDLSAVDDSDFLVAYLPKGVPTTGTVHEIINKSLSKKPVLIVCLDGKEFVPFWYWAFIPHSQMFGSWEDLYQYLNEVNVGSHSDNYRWDYICGRI